MFQKYFLHGHQNSFYWFKNEYIKKNTKMSKAKLY